LAIAALLLAGTASAATAIGEKAGKLEFKDIRYLPRSLDEVGEGKAYVLYFFTSTCPLAQRYMGRINEMAAAYAEQGVLFTGINVGVDDTIMDVAQYGLDYQAPFPLVKDMTGDCAKSLGISRTPEVAVLDAQKVLRYRGRIDDQYRLGGVRPEPSRHDLKLALDAVLVGKEVEVAETTPEGCALTFASVPEPEAPLTYAAHIAPIMNQHCVSCHREGGGAPFALDTYKRVSARAEMISEVVSEGRMPPWYAHPRFASYENNRLLQDHEKLHVAQWLASGKAPGDLDAAPAPPEFRDSEWAFEPDVILSPNSHTSIPPTGFVAYKYVMLPHRFEEDTWVQGIEIRNEVPEVLHHANLVYRPEEGRFSSGRHFLTGKVPGGQPALLPAGMAMLIPKGSVLALQIHYVTVGRPERDRVFVGLQFAKVPVKKRVYFKLLDDNQFEIPPRARAHRVTDEAELEADADVLGTFTHMHLRGRDMTFLAHLPNGETQTITSIPNYNFDWQIAYYLEPGSMRLPKGTRVEAIAHFDNSAFNAYNPDPTITVHKGDQTVDEMMNGFVFYTRVDEILDIEVDPATGHAVSAQTDAK
jgi:mono/diheme cytochrome c family protein/thiol-disulfide isomerase/thioredoxin